MEELHLYKMTFEAYLINVGMRSLEYGHKDDVLYSNIEFFRKCYEYNLSAYKALLFLGDYIRDDEKEKWFRPKEEILKELEEMRKRANISSFGDPVEWQKKEREDRNLE